MLDSLAVSPNPAGSQLVFLYPIVSTPLSLGRRLKQRDQGQSDSARSERCRAAFTLYAKTFFGAIVGDILFSAFQRHSSFIFHLSIIHLRPAKSTFFGASHLFRHSLACQAANISWHHLIFSSPFLSSSH